MNISKIILMLFSAAIILSSNSTSPSSPSKADLKRAIHTHLENIKATTRPGLMYDDGFVDWIRLNATNFIKAGTPWKDAIQAACDMGLSLSPKKISRHPGPLH